MSTIATQGLASDTTSEITALKVIYSTGGSSDAALVIKSMINAANKAVNVTPQAATSIVTSGSSVQTGTTANTSQVSAQATAAYSLAMGYELTGNSQYLSHAKNLLLAWAKTNVPTGDSVANAPLLKMFQAYDLIRNTLSSSDQNMVDHWMSGIADALIAGQSAAVKSGSITAVNNHHSWQLLEVGTIGAVLGNATYIHYVTDQSGFLKQIGDNLKSFAGEPPYLGVDYDQRHAYHYVAYNLEALGQLGELIDRIGHMPGNPYGINYNPFTVQVGGASIQNTLDALLPYASGEKVSTTEFQGSHDPNDAARLANGSLSSTFHPSDAISALEAADYFGHTVNDPLTGHSYNLAQLTGIILQNEGKTPISTTLPDTPFLQDTVTSPYYGTSTSTGAVTSPTVKTATISIPTYSGNHSYDAGNANDSFVFYKHTGQTIISHFGSGDTLSIESKIYATAGDALSHVQYANGNAVLALDSGSSITLTGIASHGLAASDFHIFS